MGEIWAQLPAWMGTVPGWITSAGVLGLLGLAVRWQLGLRKLSIEAQQVQVTAKEVAAKDDADIRDHYADEVRQLREALERQAQRQGERDERYRRLLEEADKRHEECQKSREEMRDEIRTLKDELAGMRRTMVRYSSDAALMLAGKEGAPSEEVRAAAERVIVELDKIDAQHPPESPSPPAK